MIDCLGEETIYNGITWRKTVAALMSTENEVATRVFEGITVFSTLNHVGGLVEPPRTTLRSLCEETESL